MPMPPIWPGSTRSRQERRCSSVRTSLRNSSRAAPSRCSPGATHSSALARTRPWPRHARRRSMRPRRSSRKRSKCSSPSGAGRRPPPCFGPGAGRFGEPVASRLPSTCSIAPPLTASEAQASRPANDSKERLATEGVPKSKGRRAALRRKPPSPNRKRQRVLGEPP